MYNIDIATIAIIAANVLVSLKGFNDTSFFERYKFSIGAIKAGQKDRMVTSGFLHVDISHLLFNMLTLYFFAGVVINWFGPVQFCSWCKWCGYRYFICGNSFTANDATRHYVHSYSCAGVCSWYRIFTLFYLRNEKTFG